MKPLPSSLAMKMLSALYLARSKPLNNENRVGVNLRYKMTKECTKCGRTKSRIAADAKNLGLLQEFQSGAYNCCQIVEWAEEQWLAWLEATMEDSTLADNMTGPSQVDEGDSEGVLFPVRLRRRQGPRYRVPDGLR
jgi:hypothetical protein